MWWCLSNPHRWAGNICGGFIFVYGVGMPYAKNPRGWSGFESARKNLKKLAKKCWHPARRMVLYLSAKRWDKRMTSESQLEVKRKEPIDVRKFRPAPRNWERSKFAGEIRITKNFEKKSLTKNHFCDKIIKLSAGWLRRTGPWKLNNIEKLVTEPIFVLEKHGKQFQTK